MGKIAITINCEIKYFTCKCSSSKPQKPKILSDFRVVDLLGWGLIMEKVYVEDVAL